MTKASVPAGVRVVAVVLIGGGVAGVLAGLWAEVAFYKSSALFVVIPFTLLYAWSVWVGIDLWRGRPPAYRWAKLLFALQIPNIDISGFAFHFYEGLMLNLSFTRDVAARVNFNFGLVSQFNFRLGADSGTVVLGVNLAAIVILLYLVSKTPRAESLSAPAAAGS